MWPKQIPRPVLAAAVVFLIAGLLGLRIGAVGAWLGLGGVGSALLRDAQHLVPLASGCADPAAPPPLSSTPDALVFGHAANVYLQILAAGRLDGDAADDLVVGELPTGTRGDERTRQVEIIGTTLAYLDVIQLDVVEGRAWTEFEAARGRAVVVIGRTIARKLFPEGDYLGREVRIEQQPFRVIGLLKERGTKLGNDLDAKALIPEESMLKHYGTGMEQLIVVKAASPRLVEASQDQVTQVLRARRGVPLTVAPCSRPQGPWAGARRAQNTLDSSTEVMCPTPPAARAHAWSAAGVGAVARNPSWQTMVPAPVRSQSIGPTRPARAWRSNQSSRCGQKRAS